MASPSQIFRIGASGHRYLGDIGTQQFVAKVIREQLLVYQVAYPHLVLYASLAIGADQLFVQIALDLHIPVEAVIPRDDYETDYAPGAERDLYFQLLQQCQKKHLVFFWIN